MDKKRDYLLPVSIIVAAVLVSGALVYNVGRNASDPNLAADVAGEPSLPTSSAASNIKPVDAGDHLRGNPDAPIKIVEFSDFECPFCKRFHFTMQQVLDNYGDQVAWVYRQFPLVSLHSKAFKEAEASECAAELGGNGAFWAYADRIFEITPSNDGLDLDKLPEIAEEIGLDRGEFETCLNSGRHISSVDEDVEDAASSGGRGTPYSVMIVNGEQFVPINGAQPYESVKLIIDQALQSL